MFYLITIKDDSQSIMRYATSNEASSAFHTEMAYAYNANINTTCILTDMYGSQLKRERYQIPVEVEPVNEQ